MRSTAGQRRRDGGRLGRGVQGQRARTRRGSLGIETLEGRRVLAASYVYGIDNNNDIYQIDPVAKVDTKIFATNLSGTGNANAFAYDYAPAPSGREYLFYMHGTGANTGADQTLWVYNKTTGKQSVVASASDLDLLSVVFQPADAAFYDNSYWFFRQGQAGGVTDLYEVVLDYSNVALDPEAAPVFGSLIAHPIDYSDVIANDPTFDPSIDNIFGDIAINRQSGVCYVSTSSGPFYSINLNTLPAPATTAAPATWIGATANGQQLSFNVDYSKLFAQQFSLADGTGEWFIMSTTDASLTPLGWTSDIGFRDLGGASPVPAPALAITKSDGVDTVFAGDGVVHSYTITVSNTGQVPADSVVVTDDTWPAGFVQGSVTAPEGTTFQSTGGGNFTWTFDVPLAAGASKTLVVPYTVPFGAAAGLRTNTAVVTSPDDPEEHEGTDTTRVVSNAVVAANDLGCTSSPRVYVMNPYSATPTEVFSSFVAYPDTPSFRGGVRVAVGDVDGDGLLDIVTAPGPGRRGEIRVFNLDGTTNTNFRQNYLPFGSAYRDGIEINVGDVDGDDIDDLVASKSRGPGEVQVAKSRLISPPAVPPAPTRTFEAFKSFTAFGGTYRGGASAAIGSRLDDTTVAIVVGSGPGMRPMVKNYTLNSSSGALAFVNQYAPVMPTGTAGVSVTTQKFTGGVLDTLVAAGRNGNSKVSVYQGGNNLNTNNYSPFASLGKPNAPVFAAASSLASQTVLVDTVFMVQGDGGVNTIKKVNSTTGNELPFAPLYLGRPLVSPLRIATNAARQI